MLSKKSKYALKALLVLAQEAGRGPVLVADLAAREALPKKFLGPRAILPTRQTERSCRAGIGLCCARPSFHRPSGRNATLQH